jgi:hypothetical protein
VSEIDHECSQNTKTPVPDILPLVEVQRAEKYRVVTEAIRSGQGLVLKVGSFD